LLVALIINATLYEDLIEHVVVGTLLQHIA